MVWGWSENGDQQQCRTAGPWGLSTTKLRPVGKICGTHIRLLPSSEVNVISEVDRRDRGRGRTTDHLLGNFRQTVSGGVGGLLGSSLCHEFS